jgi:hypothetical protein
VSGIVLLGNDRGTGVLDPTKGRYTIKEYLRVSGAPIAFLRG